MNAGARITLLIVAACEDCSKEYPASPGNRWRGVQGVGSKHITKQCPTRRRIPTNNPWTQCNLNKPKYILDGDRAAITAIEARLEQSKAQEKHKEARRLQLELFPEPFIGRVDAPIVLLGLNPEFKNDDPSWHQRPVMREAVTSNLTQQPQDFRSRRSCV